jgi:hypothetical protein
MKGVGVRFSRPCNTVLLGIVLLCGTVGCGSGPVTRSDGDALTRAGDLPGWRVVADAPGIAELAPDLAGLDVTRRTETAALVRRGDAIRAAELDFATPKQAEEALARASGNDYQAALAWVLRGDTVGREPGVGYRLRVPRPTGEGSDTVEVLLVRSGRRVVLLELISARGFAPELRSRIVMLVSR